MEPEQEQVAEPMEVHLAFRLEELRTAVEVFLEVAPWFLQEEHWGYASLEDLALEAAFAGSAVVQVGFELPTLEEDLFELEEVSLVSELEGDQFWLVDLLLKVDLVEVAASTDVELKLD